MRKKHASPEKSTTYKQRRGVQTRNRRRASAATPRDMRDGPKEKRLEIAAHRGRVKEARLPIVSRSKRTPPTSGSSKLTYKNVQETE